MPPLLFEQVQHDATIEVGARACGLKIVIAERNERLLHRGHQRLGHRNLALKHVANCCPQRLMADAVVVSAGIPSLSLLFKTRFIVIRLFVHERLNRKQHAPQRLPWGPRGPIPRAQDGKTDLPINVQIGVEANSAPACGHQSHFRRVVWVVVRAFHHKVEETAFIWALKRTYDERMYKSEIRFIDVNKYSWQRICVQTAQILFYPS
mmetsp:Transcript_23710/g.47873  ORF Transcript_23710/g.47873 Transcript_23710/m.47873 type:complete len:207 (-) Transcript_23710:421-1041(-)